MENFWDFNTWGTLNVVSVLLISLLAGNIVKKQVPFLKKSLIPISVLGGIILILVAAGYKAITGDVMFDAAFFGGRGTATMEVVTYHTLALGFIASAFRPAQGKMTKKRTTEIFNTGVTTVATYLLQAVFGFGISLIAAQVVAGFFPAAGVLRPFGYGQGTGQAMNYGTIYETEFGFVGGKSFGLTIAALGFLCASIGGVVHLNLLRRKGKLLDRGTEEGVLRSEQIQGHDEIPMQESIDKLTIQV
ncbi:MAG: hypothetical protein IJY02_01120, partial [Oscillospiraceae bacterium]|nr:hypothetical protein [Oscillospiraceae bacterium]